MKSRFNKRDKASDISRSGRKVLLKKKEKKTTRVGHTIHF